MSYSIDPNDVKDDLLPEGSYVVRIRGCGYGTTKGKGTPYQRIKGLIMAGPIDKLTDVNDAQPRSESLNCDLWLTEGCRTQNARALAACAVTGPVDLANNDATHTALVGATGGGAWMSGLKMAIAAFRSFRKPTRRSRHVEDEDALFIG